MICNGSPSNWIISMKQQQMQIDQSRNFQTIILQYTLNCFDSKHPKMLLHEIFKGERIIESLLSTFNLDYCKHYTLKALVAALCDVISSKDQSIQNIKSTT